MALLKGRVGHIAFSVRAAQTHQQDLAGGEPVEGEAGADIGHGTSLGGDVEQRIMGNCVCDDLTSVGLCTAKLVY